MDKLYAFDKSMQKKLILDLGVYNVHQNFRIIGSSKIGKQSYLQCISESGEYVPLSKDIFIDCLLSPNDLCVNVKMDLQPKTITSAKRIRIHQSKNVTCSEYPVLDQLVKKQIGSCNIRRATLYENKGILLHWIISFRRYMKKTLF